tara:strand:- start:308 stop:430 length:123 start_codon:yes stop_codon:yes gene_type:complete
MTKEDMTDKKLLQQALDALADVQDTAIESELAAIAQAVKP